jgi:hypothetical protein
MELQEKVAELDKAITWWQNALVGDNSKMQKEAKEAIIRKLKHQRRKLVEEQEGFSLLTMWEDIRDTAIENYDELAGHLAENFNSFFKEETFLTPPTIPPKDQSTVVTTKNINQLTSKDIHHEK